jgi:hypothetical protein
VCSDRHGNCRLARCRAGITPPRIASPVRQSVVRRASADGATVCPRRPGKPRARHVSARYGTDARSRQQLYREMPPTSIAGAVGRESCGRHLRRALLAGRVPGRARALAPGMRYPLRVAVANGTWPSLVKALDWGSRERRFESARPDSLNGRQRILAAILSVPLASVVSCPRIRLASVTGPTLS